MTAWAIIFAACIYAISRTNTLGGWFALGLASFLLVVAYTIGDLLSLL